MDRTLKILLFTLVALLPGGAAANEKVQTWNWYYAAFNSPELRSGVFLRHGVAKSLRSDSSIRISFSEAALPEIQPSFSGYVSESDVIQGRLVGFFTADGDERADLSGEYRKSGNVASCHFEEIILRPGVPDGSVLVLSRIQGLCE